MKPTDEEIQTSVMSELNWDTRVSETEVGVTVDAGVVTLSGTVPSWAKRVAAQEAAHRVIGVLDVANDIKVKLPGTQGITDTELAHAVRHALEWDAFVPHAKIKSTVGNGFVTLEGEVDYFSQREDAERVVRGLRGVVGLSNKIVVTPATGKSVEVRRSIEQALARQARRHAHRVHLEVRDGVVSLSGEVDSWAEREAVVGAARGTRGVREVDAKLLVAPFPL